MSDVKRYEYKPHGVGFIRAKPEGWYVLADEHDAAIAALRADNERLREALTEARDMIREGEKIGIYFPMSLHEKMDSALAGAAP